MNSPAELMQPTTSTQPTTSMQPTTNNKEKNDEARRRNARERGRIKKINQTYKLLQSKLPFMDKKSSRHAILIQAIKYINALETLLEGASLQQDLPEDLLAFVID